MLSWEDFLQQYQHTYFRIALPHLKTKVTAFLNEPIDNQKKTFSAVTKEYKNLVLRYDSSLALDYTFPKVRVFEYDGLVYSFERMPARQWSRGVNTQNSRISSSLIQNEIEYNHELLTAAWNSYPESNLIKACEKLKDPMNLAISLTDRFWISESITDILPMLWYNKSIIGLIDIPNKKLLVQFPPILQEIQDYLVFTNQKEWSCG